MGSHNHTRSNLFLIELIIALLFFSLGSAVCVQAFVKARTLTAQAEDLSFASSAVSSAASVVKYTDGSLEQVRAYFPGAVPDGEGGEDIAVCYDGSFAPCGDADAVYTLRIHMDAPGPVRYTHIRMDGRDGETIYELHLNYPSSEEVAYG